MVRTQLLLPSFHLKNGLKHQHLLQHQLRFTCGMGACLYVYMTIVLHLLTAVAMCKVINTYCCLCIVVHFDCRCRHFFHYSVFLLNMSYIYLCHRKIKAPKKFCFFFFQIPHGTIEMMGWCDFCYTYRVDIGSKFKTSLFLVD